MKLLVLANNPSRPSFRQRVEIYLQTLRHNGIDPQVAKLPVEKSARRRLFKQTADFDCVFLQKKCLNFFDALRLRKHSKKIIYDFDDAIMYSPNSPAADKTSHFRLFRRTVKLADMVIAGNSYLAEHAKRFNDNVHILPTGLDTNEYSVEHQPKTDGKIRLVWIGSKSTLKYLAELKGALEEIGKQFDNIVLRIICDDFFDLRNMEVERRQWSLKDQAIDLATADIGLAPLPNNRFTMGKCGFKILQYQAAHLPVITSPVGVNSDFVCDGVTGFLAADLAEWTDKITRLIEDPDLRKQMSDGAKTHVEKYDCNVISKKLCDLIGG